EDSRRHPPPPAARCRRPPPPRGGRSRARSARTASPATCFQLRPWVRYLSACAPAPAAKSFETTCRLTRPTVAHVYRSTVLYTWIRARMRTNIEIDDTLMAQAQKASGRTTKKETVEEALRLMIRLRQQE